MMRLLFLLLPLVFATSTGDLQTTLQEFCKFLYGLVGDIAFIMILLSSLIYSIAQTLPADPRARATVYAQHLLVGAFVGIILLILIPSLVGIMIGKSFDPTNCNFV
ncbi:MAG: hypothetical protein GXN92_01780 [Candidatus Micrarchaeota archaeon]|nr:hypothetical protein [Candidatus Micrarchaeota archaeon]